GGAGPGLVSYSVTSTGTGNVCAITGASLSASAAGTCVVTAHQAASGAYAALTSVAKTFTITLTPLSVANTTLTGTAGTALTLTSAGGAGPGLVSYSVTSTGTGNVCAITGASLSASAAGTCVVTAHQAASGSYAALTSVAKTFTIT
ncbi:MAG TPA: hypothetical protein VIJ40_02135, partial [Acidimicrobiales bacterium]